MTRSLEIANLSVEYDGNLAVDCISLNVQEGEMLGIVGPNGAGKTTMFRAVLGLQQYSGSISVFGLRGSEYLKLLPMIGYVPQKVSFEPNFPATVYDIVSMEIMSEAKQAQGDKLAKRCGFRWNRMYGTMKGTDQKVDKALKTVGLSHLYNRRIGELSSGELQRVFIAKSLIKDPIMLILDEPVTSVDVESQTKFYSVIRKINKENEITMVWSSHDLDAVSEYADRVACMNKNLFFHGEKETFFADETLLKTYTESSMQAHMHGHNATV